jgi:glycosyltransferase involved in cell wall biosynthesis
MNIQFFKRDDNSSIDFVGSRYYDQIARRQCYPINVKSLTKYIHGQHTARADVGIMFGIFRDLYCLQNYKHKIAGLVCESDLTSGEVEKVQEADPTQIWVPSNFVAEKFIKAGIQNIALMPYGVDDLPEAKEIDSDEWRIGMIFNSYPQPNFHVRRKGIFETLQALSNLDNIKLVLRTDDRPYYSQFKDKVDIEFVPRLEDIGVFYDSVDIVLAPSHSEGFGLIGMEAIARGKPLISTKTGNDYLTEGISYTYLEEVSPKAIREAVMSTVSNYDNLLTMAREQRPAFIEANSWETRYETMDRMIQSLF